MQGIEAYIPYEEKAALIGALDRVGFSALDCVSFVSPKWMPQMRDAEAVLAELPPTQTPLLAIVANEKGCLRAIAQPTIHSIGYPLSVSDTFQQRNTQQTITASLPVVAALQSMCATHDKQFVVYLSMAFGNPYGDAYSAELVLRQVAALLDQGITTIVLSDTVGMGVPTEVEALCSAVYGEFGGNTGGSTGENIGVHLHARADKAHDVVSAAFQGGCSRFDGAIGGFGGCPMADDGLVGNVPMEVLVAFFAEQGIETGLDMAAWEGAKQAAIALFTQYA